MNKYRYALAAVALFSSSLALSVNAADSHAAHAEESQAVKPDARLVINTKGVVNDIDLAAKKVTITHEAIPVLNWPAMKMRFTFSDSSLLGDVKVNDRVNLDFIQQGNLSLLQKIERAE